MVKIYLVGGHIRDRLIDRECSDKDFIVEANSFNEMIEDVGRARVYAGIHYTYTCTESNKQGARIAANILNILRFQK